MIEDLFWWGMVALSILACILAYAVLDPARGKGDEK